MQDWFWRPAGDTLTGKSRHRLGKKEELVLQVETELAEQHMNGDTRQRILWRDARVHDLQLLRPQHTED